MPEHTLFPSIVEEDDDDNVPIASSPIDPTDLTVDELRDALDDEDYDWDAAALRGLRESEVYGDERQTALETINDAINKHQED